MPKISRTKLIIFLLVALLSACMALLHYLFSDSEWLVIAGPVLILAAGSLFLFIPQAQAEDPTEQIGQKINGKVNDALLQFKRGKHDYRLSSNDHSEDAVVAAVNEILSSLEYIIEREQAFSANVAHELKTPLAELLSTIDLALLKDRGSNEYKEFFIKLKGICSSMHEMHDNILALARSDQGLITAERKHFSLANSIQSSLKSFEADFLAKGVEVSMQCQHVFHINRGREKIRMVFNNLFSNMLCYMDEGGTATVQIQQDVSGVGISFKNTGCQLNPKDARHVLDPFWRSGPDQHNEKRHLGVGLNMCQRILSALGASIKIHISKNGVFHANIFLPFDLIVSNSMNIPSLKN